MTGPGFGEGQPCAHQAGQQPLLPTHLRGAAVIPLAFHGLSPGAILPLHLRQVAQGQPGRHSHDVHAMSTHCIHLEFIGFISMDGTEHDIGVTFLPSLFCRCIRQSISAATCSSSRPSWSCRTCARLWCLRGRKSRTRTWNCKRDKHKERKLQRPRFLCPYARAWKVPSNLFNVKRAP